MYILDIAEIINAAVIDMWSELILESINKVLESNAQNCFKIQSIECFDKHSVVYEKFCIVSSKTLIHSIAHNPRQAMSEVLANNSVVPFVLGVVIGVPSVILYTIEAVVLLRNWSKFSSAFFRL
ncbi:hypothetical protein DdX_17497 [Ditylenchus destructor]|uniref:Uncharacterized protein n=1 Tax=Ditylenchus destructor TaxID=166010 RepID=A0AAD4MRA2_9BILA|nr:hypothetical protein DdX_17497 [Ditylenchus destructor]